MRSEVESSALLRIVLTVALLGSVLPVAVMAPPTVPVPSRFARRDFSMHRHALPIVRTAPVSSSAPSAIVRSFRDRTEDVPDAVAGDPFHPRVRAHAPLFRPPPPPPCSRPHVLRC